MPSDPDEESLSIFTGMVNISDKLNLLILALADWRLNIILMAVIFFYLPYV